MSAVLERDRRMTAGRRLTTLVGQAAEDDTAFWGHDTWASDNESYSDNDEARDEFDSDFNDSESESEQETDADKELQLQERQAPKKRSYVDIAAKAVKKKKKRAMGMNAGLVLNIPKDGSAAPIRPRVAPAAAMPAKPVASSTSVSMVHSAATRPRRSVSKFSSRYRAARDTNDTNTDLSSKQRKISSTTKKRSRFSQEQLLLEAVRDTEPENARWLLGRQRLQESNDSIHATETVRGTVVERLVSRRNYLTVLTFPEMDHLPPLLATTQSRPIVPKPTLCAITGKPARYRDPQTMLGYHDAAAFQEIRRRVVGGALKPASKTAASSIAKPKANTATAAVMESVMERVPVSVNIAPAVSKAAPTASSGASQTGAESEASATKPAPDAVVLPPATASFQDDSIPTNGKKLAAAAVHVPAEPAAPTQGDWSPAIAADLQPRPASVNPITTDDFSTQLLPKSDNGLTESVVATSPRRDSMTSNTSTNSRRASPRRRKPSAKVRQDLQASSSSQLSESPTTTTAVLRHDEEEANALV